MVKICSMTEYSKENEDVYINYFNKFKHPLHIFQKFAIEGIVNDNHVLICAPTGSGKSLPAEFAVDYFHSKNKKLIYCSPIKALSNQKYHDFVQKYPNISIGLITGDIKSNPDADILIMTTEILLNKIYQTKSNTQVQNQVSFNMDIINELGCVVFDEIHMINDPHRGHVWEQCIMLLPNHIQIIGLSATLDNPEKFATWIETKNADINNKNVYLSKQQERFVPLTHYSFITATQSIFKTIKDKSIHAEINNIINKPIIIQPSSGKFNDENYFKTNKILTLFNKHNIRIKRQHVLNQVSEYLTKHKMTPAICYVFSKKQLEKCASEITTNLLENDSKIPCIIEQECEMIIRKLSNYNDYLHLPEYIKMVQLLKKGIAIHHAGLLPILREIVELLFAKGYIKLLFATETVAIGLNLPVKTTIFTDINKFDGVSNRMLYPHEYTQSSGRAGRLGLDTVGHVIHLNNLFRNINLTDYKLMLGGKPQILTSKFKISYNLILNFININNSKYINDFINKSMSKNDIQNKLNHIQSQIDTNNTIINTINDRIKLFRTPFDVVKTYVNIQANTQMLSNKKKKDNDKQIKSIIDLHKFIETDSTSYKKYLILNKENELMTNEYNIINLFNTNNISSILNLLTTQNFITNDSINNINNTDTNTENNEMVQLTTKGKISNCFNEIPCLSFANLFNNNVFANLSPIQLVMVFSCFTNINVKDDFKYNNIIDACDDNQVVSIILKTRNEYDKYEKYESQHNLNTGTDYNIHYDLIQYMNEWCKSNTIEDCKIILQKMEQEKEIFLGEFIKAVLKINNISCELEKAAEMTNNIILLEVLQQIPKLTLKYVITNQSLYI
mgnify:FL=1